MLPLAGQVGKAQVNHFNAVLFYHGKNVFDSSGISLHLISPLNFIVN
jgi:hypothetical protein